MSILSFCDLDGTFVQTSRHVPDVSSDIVYTAAGKDIVITDKQLQLYTQLLRSGLVIPVTARSLESMNRMLSTLTFPAHKVCDHGVFIYDEADKVVREYSDSLIKLVSPHQNDLRVILDRLSRLALNNNIFSDIQFKAIYHNTYLMCIEGTALTAFQTKALSRFIKEPGIIVSTNGRSFSVTCEVNSYKQLACQYLVENYPQYQDCVTLGFGDSLSDLPFMQFCDFSVVPNNERTQIKLGD